MRMDLDDDVALMKVTGLSNHKDPDEIEPSGSAPRQTIPCG